MKLHRKNISALFAALLATSAVACAVVEVDDTRADDRAATGDDRNVTSADAGAVEEPYSVSELSRLCVPPSVMMHSKDVERAAKLITWLKANDYTPITYQDFVDIMEDRKVRPQRPVILSLDDVTPAYISSYFQSIVNNAVKEDFPITLAVNPQVPGDSPWGKNGWSMINGWHAKGIDISTHGTMHYNLGAVTAARGAGAFKTCDESDVEDEKLQKEADNEKVAANLEFLLGKSSCRLREATEAPMETLILPFGLPRYAPQDQGADDQSKKTYPVVEAKAAEHGLKLIVGIPGGRIMDRTVRLEPRASAELPAADGGAATDGGARSSTTQWSAASYSPSGTDGGAVSEGDGGAPAAIYGTGERYPAYPAFVGRVDVLYAADNPEIEIRDWYRCPKGKDGKPTECVLSRCAALDNGELQSE